MAQEAFERQGQSFVFLHVLVVALHWGLMGLSYCIFIAMLKVLYEV